MIPMKIIVIIFKDMIQQLLIISKTQTFFFFFSKCIYHLYSLLKILVVVYVEVSFSKLKYIKSYLK